MVFYRTILPLFLLFLASCASRQGDTPSKLVSMQTIDRNGFTETIGAKDRLALHTNTDFLKPQPYQKVLRVFAKNHRGQSHSHITSYHDNGLVWQSLEVVDGRANGSYLEWHPNGVQKVEAHVIEGLAEVNEAAQVSWVFEGLNRVWDAQGQIMAEFSYQKGILQGTAQIYHPNGLVWKSIPYAQDEIEGVTEVFDNTGQLKESIPFVKGLKHGKAKGEGPNRIWSYEEEYEAGALKTGFYSHAKFPILPTVQEGEGFSTLFVDDHVKTIVEIRKGHQEGSIRLFRPDGSLQSLHHVKEGKKHGEEWEFFPSEPKEDPLAKPIAAKMLVFWQEDVLQGVAKTWYENGVLQSQRAMSHNKKHGLSTGYYTDGSLMLTEEYDNDRLIKGSYFKHGDKAAVSRVEGGKGSATLFDAEGYFLKTISYEKGYPILHE